MPRHQQGQKRHRQGEEADGRRLQARTPKLLAQRAGGDTDDGKREYGDFFRLGDPVLHRARHFERADEGKRINERVEKQVVHENFQKKKQFIRHYLNFYHVALKSQVLMVWC